MRKVMVCGWILIVLLTCSNTVSVIENKLPWKKFINPSPQRTGQADKGYDYLVNGDYVSSGIPIDLLGSFGMADSSNMLNRSGKARLLPPQFNLIQKNGIELAAPNCLTCHSDHLNGQFVIGLGNTTMDYRYDLQSGINFLSGIIKQKYGAESDTYKAFSPFHKASMALSGKLRTEARGPNPADKLTAVLIAHRDPSSLAWSDSLLVPIPDENIPTDVPPWWHLKKKNAMFYTGIGRGDFSRFLMASSILTLSDTSEARVIDQQFPNVLAWIKTLEAPEYPKAVDKRLAEEGKRLFELNCSTCHGTYGPSGNYPNLLVALDKVGTDPALSNAYTDGLYSNFINWYNESWFTTGDHPGQLVIDTGYVAPPLDGIWATAPYFHNGSVPTVEAVLNSKERPQKWARSFNNSDYDYQTLGWKYKVLDSLDRCNCYDTTLKGYGNAGHPFGDDLDEDERLAVIEYLKTI